MQQVLAQRTRRWGAVCIVFVEPRWQGRTGAAAPNPFSFDPGNAHYELLMRHAVPLTGYAFTVRGHPVLSSARHLGPSSSNAERWARWRHMRANHAKRVLLHAAGPGPRSTYKIIYQIRHDMQQQQQQQQRACFHKVHTMLRCP